MLRGLPFAFLAGTSLLAGWACEVTIKDGDVSVNQLHGRAKQEWNRKYQFAPGSRIELINTNGSIDVVTGSAGTAEVAAVMDARSMTDERSRELLNESKIEETITPGSIRIATVRSDGSTGVFGNRRRGRLEVNYRVTVPADARVEMTGNNGTLTAQGLRGHVKGMVTNGALVLSGLRGSVDAASVNGSVTVKMAEVTAKVRLESTNGRINLEIPKDSKATLSVRSVNGSINVTGLTAQDPSGRRVRNLESVLNGGGPEIDVRVTNGRVTIAGVDHPSPVDGPPSSADRPAPP